MIVGITYDLRSDYLKEGFTEEETAEFDKESTVDAIEYTLTNLGYQVVRIGHVRHLIRELARGNRWDMVFNISEGMFGIGREAQVPAILDTYQIPYTFSDPLVLSLTLHKGMTKRVIRDGGIATPDFTIVDREEDVKSVGLPYPLFVKPNAEGSGKGISFNSKAQNPAELLSACRKIWETVPGPLLVETYLPGREFTTGILGTGEDSFCVGSMEVIFNEHAKDSIYSYDMKTLYEQFISYALPEAEVASKCAVLALKAWKLLGCRDGGRIDIRMDAYDNPNFIEVNPLAGMNDLTSDLPILARMNGYDYPFVIRTIMESAKKRIKKS
jgi:D-alanine-D-alanine ligase